MVSRQALVVLGLSIGALLVLAPRHPAAAALTGFRQPGGVAVDSATNKIYVVNEEGSSVAVLDGETNRVATIYVGSKPRYVAVDPITHRIYTTRYFCRCVSIMDGIANVKIADVPL